MGNGLGPRDEEPQNSAEVERLAELPDQYLQERQIYSSTSPPRPSEGAAACLGGRD